MAGIREITPFEQQRIASVMGTGGFGSAALGQRIAAAAAQKPLLQAPGGLNWVTDSPAWRQSLQQAQLNREGGDIVGPAYQEMFGGTDALAYDPTSRSSYARDPKSGYMWRAQRDAQGNIIPGSVTKTSTKDTEFGLAAMAAMGITGANILAAQAAMAGAGAGASGGAGAAGTTGAATPGATGGLGGIGTGAVGGTPGFSVPSLLTAEEALAAPISFEAGSVGAGTLGAGGGLGVSTVMPTIASESLVLGELASAGAGLPQASYSHEGLNYGKGGLDPVTNAPVNVGAGAPTSALGNLGSSFKEWALKNPMQAIQLAGMLGGKLAGGQGGGGSGIGAVDQSQLTATKPAAFQREYVAPPAGFRPGISGEHVYFKKKGG